MDRAAKTSSTRPTSERRPLVTICIPTYNGARYLPAALQAVNQQTYSDIEVVFSDDGSIDDTPRIVESFASAARWPVRTLEHRQSALADNWNACVEHAHGKYIKFLFQDDLLAPQSIERLVQAAEADDDVCLAFSARNLLIEDEVRDDRAAHRIINGCADVHAAWSHLRPIQQGSDLLADPKLVLHGPLNKVGEPTAVLLNRELLLSTGGFDPGLCQLVDVDMWWRLFAIGKVAFVDAPLATFRIHASQESLVNARARLSDIDLVKFAKKTLRSPLRPLLHPVSVWALRQYVGKLDGVRGKLWSAMFYARTLPGRLRADRRPARTVTAG